MAIHLAALGVLVTRGVRRMVTISKYLDPRLVCLLDVSSRDEAISTLVEVADANDKLIDKDAFYKALLEREKVVSTGIGMGVAIPHAKLPTYEDFFIVVGVLCRGLDWSALDSNPVHIIFMIGGPDDKQTEYLQILSNLTVAIKDEERRKDLLAMSSPEDILHLFESH